MTESKVIPGPSVTALPSWNIPPLESLFNEKRPKKPFYQCVPLSCQFEMSKLSACRLPCTQYMLIKSCTAGFFRLSNCLIEKILSVILMGKRQKSKGLESLLLIFGVCF